MPGLAQKGTKSEVKLIRTAVCPAYLLQIKHKIVFKKIKSLNWHYIMFKSFR